MAGEKRDLTVSQWEYAYLRDGTKGTIKVFTGPTVVTPSAQDEGIIYNAETRKFEPCGDLALAKRSFPNADEGFYCVLQNPAKDRKQPDEGGQSSVFTLDVGRKINIPGPVMFALWPGQSAEVIQGHQLRYNQYLIARVYNEEEAKKNWLKAVVKPASPITPPAENATVEEKAAYAAAVKAAEAEAKVATAAPPRDLTVGKLLIIRGTEVSFYIPPTGISVVAEEDEAGNTQYVREALTLERLEYAILLDENGNKRYVNGPTVVFPAPTEHFKDAPTDDGRMGRKFRAIELNELQGLHLKAIAAFKDEKGVEHKAGEELFITGKDTAIYYPQEEVAAVSYDGKTQHFAAVIPAGEGRYVMNRLTGDIVTLRGPIRSLPDPRKEVFVRRPLTDVECQDIYPDDAEMLLYHRELREILKKIPTTRGAPSEGDVERNYKGAKGGPGKGSVVDSFSVNTGGVIGTGGIYASANMAGIAAAGGPASNQQFADRSRVSKDQKFAGEEFVHPASMTQPRSITLGTKYQNVPVVTVKTGYAVLIVSKSGNKRRVVQGPNVVLLDYDETLEAMNLSTGQPKTTERPLRTPYLRAENNRVADIFEVETSDYVKFNIKLGYRVNFEGDSSKWWAVENYVKFLCDNLRSDLKGQIKKIPFTQFRPNATEILQGFVLQSPTGDAVKIKGRQFPENNMRVTDVEVLAVDCLDRAIEEAFKQSALAVVTTDIGLNQLRRGLEVTREKEALIKEEAEVRASTNMRKNELAIEVADSEVKVFLAKYVNDLKSIEDKAKIQAATEQMKNVEFDQEMGRRKRLEEQNLAIKEASQALDILSRKADSEAVAVRFTAAKDGLAEIAKVVRDTDAAVRISEALSMQMALGGPSFSDVAIKVLGSIPALETLVQKIAPNGHVIPANGSSDKKPSVGA